MRGVFSYASSVPAAYTILALLLSIVCLCSVVVANADESVSEDNPFDAGKILLNSVDEKKQPASPALRWKRAIDRDDGEALWRLISQVNVRGSNDKGKNALMAAAKIGDRKLLEELIRHGIRLEDKSLTGGTALMYAVLGNQAQMINYLLTRTQHLDAQSTNGWTAVMIAAAKGFDGALRQLVEAGADARLADVYQWSPLMRAIDNKHRGVINYLLALPEPGINQINENGSTALHVAAQFGDVETVERLLERGADINVLDKNSDSAEEVAMLNGYPEIVLLISQGSR